MLWLKAWLETRWKMVWMAFIGVLLFGLRQPARLLLLDQFAPRLRTAPLSTALRHRSLR